MFIFHLGTGGPPSHSKIESVADPETNFGGGAPPDHLLGASTNFWSTHSHFGIGMSKPSYKTMVNLFFTLESGPQFISFSGVY